MFLASMRLPHKQLTSHSSKVMNYHCSVPNLPCAIPALQRRHARTCAALDAIVTTTASARLHCANPPLNRRRFRLRQALLSRCESKIQFRRDPLYPKFENQKRALQQERLLLPFDHSVTPVRSTTSSAGTRPRVTPYPSMKNASPCSLFKKKQNPLRGWSLASMRLPHRQLTKIVRAI